MGTTAIHSYSGQHHLMTLCTTDAEGYELPRAVASLMGTRVSTYVRLDTHR